MKPRIVLPKNKMLKCHYHPDAPIRLDTPYRRVFECGCWFESEEDCMFSYTAGHDERAKRPVFTIKSSPNVCACCGAPLSRDIPPPPSRPVTKQNDES